MFVDAESLSDGATIAVDVCIAGAGAAGITLAREFIGEEFQVALLESGGFEFEEETQALYKGEIVGERLFNLDETRLRYFGGTTAIWDGWCRPLDTIDFEERPWVPHSGWPIDRAELIPFYRRAEAICQIGSFNYDQPGWPKDEGHALPLDPSRLMTAVYRQSPPTRFGEAYRVELDRATNVKTYLHANVVEIETNEGGSQATALRVATLSGKTLSVTAKVFVVALGGIENPRLLLLSDRVQRTGLGNGNDLVGRFFMEHIVMATGRFLPLDPDLDSDIYFADYLDGEPHMAVLTPSEETVRREQLMSLTVVLEPHFVKSATGVKSLKTILDSLGDAEIPDDFGGHLYNVIADIDDVAAATTRKILRQSPPIEYFSMHTRVEPVPDPDNRVTLVSERDALGQRRVRLDWRLGDAELRSVRRAQEIFGAEAGRAELGRVRIELADEEPVWPSAKVVSHHHMGTTRMHRDPKRGVVDEHCRVHGVDNLYVAGSSIFPATGSANPTLTLVALALRAADHIKARLG